MGSLDADGGLDGRAGAIKAKIRDVLGADRALTFEEVTRILSPSKHSISRHQLWKLFQQVDAEGTGRVNASSFIDYVFSSGVNGYDTSEAVFNVKMTSTVNEEEVSWALPIKLDQQLVHQFSQLPTSGKVIVEYVWLDCNFTDGRAFDLCSKSMTVDKVPRTTSELMVWTYSGEDESDLFLVPRRIYQDPFRKGENIIVLCDVYEAPLPESGELHGAPVYFNSRVACEQSMAAAFSKGEDPWFGIEQEYYLLDLRTKWPLGWPLNGEPGKHENYYCSVGADKAPGKEVVECHYRACLFAGVQICGINSEVAPGQWEYQLGPSPGIEAADDHWMSRYILQRVCEIFHVACSFDPKPIPDWAGLGCHTNYSTASTRQRHGGLAAIKSQCDKLGATHHAHMKVYGQGNERRMTGQASTASMDDFSWAVGARQCSIRIPAKVAAAGYGYYEDRRPAANMDPYLVTAALVKTTLLDEK
mmetsp:Transcript_53875/g.125918  ORF Transcript_53875/g.125918 Transcript_53875/m.125918 type:complete len:473 (+) Transcript_53875:60-1478(+)